MQIIERTETIIAKRNIIYEGLSVANQTAIVKFLRTLLLDWVQMLSEWWLGDEDVE